MYMEIGAQEQYNLIDTIFKYIVDVGSPGKQKQKKNIYIYIHLSPNNQLSVGRLRIVGVLDLSIDIFLEIQNQKYT